MINDKTGESDATQVSVPIQYGRSAVRSRDRVSVDRSPAARASTDANLLDLALRSTNKTSRTNNLPSIVPIIVQHVFLLTIGSTAPTLAPPPAIVQVQVSSLSPSAPTTGFSCWKPMSGLLWLLALLHADRAVFIVNRHLFEAASPCMSRNDSCFALIWK